MALSVRPLLFFLLTNLSVSCLAGMPLQLGSKAPNWILANEQGDPISFYTHAENQTAVLLFWATWCPYSRELMTKLDVLRQQVSNKPIKFYALNVWENADPKEFFQQQGLGFTLLLNAESVAKSYSVTGTPGLFVTGPDKVIQYIRNKGSSADEVITKLKEIFSRSSAHTVNAEELPQSAPSDTGKTSPPQHTLSRYF